MSLALSERRILYLSVLVVMVLCAFFAFGGVVGAEGAVKPTATSIPKIGGSTGGAEDIEETIKGLIWKIRIIGSLIIIACLILGFVIVGLSLGNAQKRAIGIGAVVCAAVAIYGVAKAPSLANWMIEDAQKTGSSIQQVEPTIQTPLIKYSL